MTEFLAIPTAAKKATAHSTDLEAVSHLAGMTDRMPGLQVARGWSSPSCTVRPFTATELKLPSE
jgi:hypothetical protein